MALHAYCSSRRKAVAKGVESLTIPCGYPRREPGLDRLLSRLRVVKAIVAALEAALRAPPQLSEDAALHRRLDDLRGAVLAVQRDYDFEGVGPKVGGG